MTGFGWLGGEACARRWLTRYGAGIAPISVEAEDLLVRRLGVRRRANLATSPLWAASGVFIVASMATSTSSDPPSGNGLAVAWWAAACTALAAAPAVRSLAQQRGERQLGARLQRRVSASTQMSVSTMLGPWRLLNVVVAFALNVAMLIGLVVMGARHGLPWIYGAALLVTVGLAVTTFRAVVRRPALAVDSDSLAIDVRLRSGDAYWVIWTLALLVAGATTPIGLLGGPRSPERSLVLLSLLVWPIVAGIEAVAQSHDRGRRRRWPSWSDAK